MKLMIPTLAVRCTTVEALRATAALSTMCIMVAEYLNAVAPYHMGFTLAMGVIIVYLLSVWCARFCLECRLPLAPQHKRLCQDTEHPRHGFWSQVHAGCCPYRPRSQKRGEEDITEVIWRDMCNGAARKPRASAR